MESLQNRQGHPWLPGLVIKARKNDFVVSSIDLKDTLESEDHTLNLQPINWTNKKTLRGQAQQKLLRTS